MIKNIWLSISLVFKYAKHISLIYIFLSCLCSVFYSLQVIALEKLISNIGLYISNNTEWSRVILWGILLICAFIVAGIYDFLRPLLTLKMYQKLMINLTPYILNAIDRIEYSKFEDSQNADVLYRVAASPYKIIQNMFISTINMMYFIFSTLSMIIVFCKYDMYLGITIIINSFIVCILQYKAEKNQTELVYKQTKETRMSEHIGGMIFDKNALYELKIFGAVNTILLKWKNILNKLMLEKKEKLKQYALIVSVKNIFVLLLLILIGIFLGHGMEVKKITYAQFYAVFATVPRYMEILFTSSGLISNVVEKSKEVDYYKRFIDMARCEEKDIPELSVHSEGIVFSHVYFKYPGTDEMILKDVSFKIGRDEYLSIVGANGAGKSTIMKLIVGLYKPTAGNVYIDGKEAVAVAKEKLAVLFQDYEKYYLTIKDNVSIGNLELLMDDVLLEETLKKVNSNLLLRYHPKQNLGNIQEDAVDLSNGEWQKLAMAKLYITPKHYICFDEPTSAMDPITESKMYASIQKLKISKTLVVVSHRIVLSKYADKIIVIDKGKIVEEGTHKQLMDNNKQYAEMYEKQHEWYKSY